MVDRSATRHWPLTAAKTSWALFPEIGGTATEEVLG